MKNRIALLFALCTLTSFAQKNLDPTPEEVSKAKVLREKYNKDDIAVLSSVDEVRFDFNNREEKVTVQIDTKEQLMNINHRAVIQKYEFYDSESSINDFSFKFRNDKKALFYVNDELYKDSDLFYNDAE